MTEAVQWGFTPEKNVDRGGFEPFKGTYIARIDRLERKVGVGKESGKPYDFYSINVQVVKKIKGDDAKKRYLSGAYNPDVDGIKKLADDLFTAGIEIDTSGKEAFEGSFEGAKDKLITVKAWSAKKRKKVGEEWVTVDPVEYVQKWNVPKKQEDISGIEEDSSDVPF